MLILFHVARTEEDKYLCSLGRDCDPKGKSFWLRRFTVWKSWFWKSDRVHNSDKNMNLKSFSVVSKCCFFILKIFIDSKNDLCDRIAAIIRILFLYGKSGRTLIYVHTHSKKTICPAFSNDIFVVWCHFNNVFLF